MAQPTLDDIAASSVDNGVVPTLDEIASNSVSPINQTPKSSQDANIWAQAQVKTAQLNDSGINPYVNAMEDTANRLPGLLTSAPASVANDLAAGKPQDIISNLGKTVTGQTSPDYTTLLKTAGVASPAANVGGTAMDVVLYPGGAQAVSQLPQLLAAGGSAASNAGQVILSKGKTLADFLTGADIQTNIVPKAEQLFQGNVTDFTPQIQKLASAQNINPDIISHIATQTPTKVEASASSLQNNPGSVEQILKSYVADGGKGDQAVNQAYANSVGAAPQGVSIAIPKATQAAQDYLSNAGFLDGNGNITNYGKSLINNPLSPNDRIKVGIFNNLQRMKDLNGAVTPSQWLDMRSNISQVGHIEPVTNILDGLHADMGDAGFDVQSSRDLAKQNYENKALAQPFITPAGGENKFKNIFNLSDDHLAMLQQLDQNLGTNLVGQAKDIASAGPTGLGKIRSLGISNGPTDPSAINELINGYASINPLKIGDAWVAGKNMESLLGKSPELTSLLSQMNARRVAAYSTEALGALAGKKILDKVTGE